MEWKRNAVRKIFSAALFALLLFSLPCAAYAQAASKDQTYSSAQGDSARTVLLSRINQERKREKLPPLTLGDAEHNAAADRRAKELAERYSCFRPNGKRDFTVLAEFDIRDVSIGENYIAGCSTPEAAMEEWMSIDFTRKRILSEDVATVSIGSYEGGRYKHYWVLIFSYPEHQWDEQFRQEVLELVNSYRAENGLPELEMGDDALTAAAQLRAQEIAQQPSHTRPDGRVCFTALEECGATDEAVGENAAWGCASPQEVVEAWIDSEDHRANILAPDATKMSIGYYWDASSDYGHQWIQLFVK